MVTVQSITNYDKGQPCAITIGTFDGVHIGHRKILSRLMADAQQGELLAAVLTFFPHPRMVLQKDTDIKLLNTIREKSQILESTGLDALIVHPFTQEFSRLTATEFVRDILVGQLQAKRVVIGYDHRFGRNRNANIQDLRAFGDDLDFQVTEIPAQEIDDVSVSSTKIRKALQEGDIRTANSYLGYGYLLTGTIQKGKGLGHQIGFPTANLHIPETYKLIPKTGAYVVKSKWGQNWIYGMMNIGYNPTVSGTEKTIEIHFFDFEEDLYGKPIQVSIIDRLRDERKFESVEALTDQLHKDREQSLDLINP